MSSIVDENKKWVIAISRDGDVEEFNVYDGSASGVVFKPMLLDGLEKAISLNEHYDMRDNLIKVISPEGEDYSKYAVFVISLNFSDEDLINEFGEKHMLLFALLVNGGIQFIGSSDSSMTLDKLVDIVNNALKEPSKLNYLYVSYPPLPT